MRKPFIAGNWKMHTDHVSAIMLAGNLKENLEGFDGVDVGVAPPFPFLGAVSNFLQGSGILVGAQNMHPEEKGAFTGEVSAGMLKSAGVDFVILGHSERRHVFEETDEFINSKVKVAIGAGFLTILCVGETLIEREGGLTVGVVDRQLTEGLKGVDNVENLVIAYEPVWAIGTGKTATPDVAQVVHKAIRVRLEELYSPGSASAIRIQYGGSVKPENAAELMAMEDIDGALVGGASLKADTFTGIIKYGEA